MEIRQTETHLSVIQYISDAIGTIRDKKELFRVITDKLRLLFKFDAAGIITLDKKQEHIQLFFESLSRVDEVFISYMAQKRPIEGTPFKEFLENPRIFSLDLQEYSRQIPESNVVVELYKAGFRQVTHVPLRSRGRVIGFLNLLFFTQNDWSKDDLRLLEKISSQIAIAVSNVLAYEEIRKREAEKELQLAVNNALLNIKARDKMMLTVAEQIDKVFSWSFLGIRIFKPDGEPLMYDLFRKDTAGKISPVPNFYTDTASSPVVSLSAYTTQKIYSENDLAELSQQNPIAKLAREKYGVRSYMIVPLWNDPKGIAAIALAHMQPNAFKDEHMAILQTIAPQISLALQNFLAFEQIESLRQQLEHEKNYLLEEVKANVDLKEIIGTSPALKSALHRARQVAPTDSTVLILGETGTGKELIAKAIHNLSPRKSRPLVKINCAALPAQLIESELFGHEKGSFTGAVDRRIGKFELADKGSIFLDEVGELPLDLQVKLLRVLQEHELDRIGGKSVVKINVRIIAATNRDLEKEVREGRFRPDLYYRLSVFPILVPPVRQRREDIPALVAHFIEKFAKQTGRPTPSIRQSDMQRLMEHEWKGNIRELEHVIEQAVIVSDSVALDFSGIFLSSTEKAFRQEQFKTLKEFENEKTDTERRMILGALEQTGGRVSGKGGAAELLDINPKTLFAKMQKLGIKKVHVAHDINL